MTLVKFRNGLIQELIEKINELNRESFAVRQHLYYVDLFGKKETYLSLSYEQLDFIKEHILSLLGPGTDTERVPTSEGSPLARLFLVMTVAW